MRKIKSMEDVERVQRRNNIILGVIMIFLLTASSLGYSLMSADSEGDNVVEEMGFDFVREGGMWKLATGGEIFSFQNLPSEIEEVNVDLDIGLGAYSGSVIYFVNPGEGVNEVLVNLERYALRYQEACLESEVVDLGNLVNETLDEGENNGTQMNEDERRLALENDCEGDLPIKDCSQNLIVFESGNETRVYGEGNCVFIVGDVLKGSDAFLYKLLGVK